MVKSRKNNKKVDQTRSAAFGDSSGMDGPLMQVESGSTTSDMTLPPTSIALLAESPIAKRLRKSPSTKPVSAVPVIRRRKARTVVPTQKEKIIMNSPEPPVPLSPNQTTEYSTLKDTIISEVTQSPVSKLTKLNESIPEPADYANLLQSLIQTNHTSKLPKFSGAAGENFKSWFDEFSTATDKKGIMEEERISILKSKLQGSARTIFEGFQAKKINTLQKLKVEMFKTFAPLDEPAQLRTRIHEIRHKDGESLIVFANMLYDKLFQAFPTLDAQAAEHLAIAHFIKAIRPEIGSKVENRVPGTLQQAIQMALVYEKEILSRTKPTSTNVNMLQFLDEDYNVACEEKAFKSKIIPECNVDQSVTLCSLMEQLNNNHQKTCQQISELKKQISEIKTSANQFGTSR